MWTLPESVCGVWGGGGGGVGGGGGGPTFVCMLM